MNIPITDLTQHPPRSPRVRLGGYALLPRMLDKGRAELLGKSGDYHYACPLDQRVLAFLGIDPEQLKAELATGKGDGEILAWMQKNQRNRPTREQIIAWSDEQERRRPDAESKDHFDELRRACAPNRTDIEVWADLLDLDDYVSYGGKA